ncbi:hypothetical protein HanXRQr2_Chr08g0349001 [Helianthus annuus]|uniref:Uncharacterized protein n=1 Tax=Helianthus annuus TaxID=4232 RepID=A0A9K3IFW7_HELAN|nr:hypothetical protein HanXRQr2_Chr08g0349001 [Helianthus annuus]KAJ0902460.1 hypothetical protein HanPSC8_Chr08g0337301 [Helianthus annuus]
MSHFCCQINKHRYYQLVFATPAPGVGSGVATARHLTTAASKVCSVLSSVGL